MENIGIVKYSNKRWMNPSILFFYLWIITIALYSLNLSPDTFPTSLYSLLFLIIYISIIYVIGKSRISLTFRNDFSEYEENFRFIVPVLIVSFGLLVAEVIAEISYFGTLPFLASFSFDGVNYNDAGVIFKYKHNIFVKSNCIFLSGYILYLHLLIKKRKIYLLGYVFVILISLLYVSRSTLISIAAISLILYLYKYKFTWKQLLVVIVFLILAAYIFDKLYFLRNKADINFYIKHYENYGFFTSVGRGLAGIYGYITTPVSNFLYNVDNGTFSLFEFRPTYLIRGFLPAKISLILFGPIEFSEAIIFPGISNTFTTFPPLIFAFGLIGCIFLCLGIALIFRRTYYNSIKKPQKWFLILVFLNHIVLLSVFSTSFTNMVYFYPILIVYLFPPTKLVKIK